MCDARRRPLLSAWVIVAVVMLASAAAAALALPREAEATFPGKNGKIAYQAFDGHDYEIYTINPSGGGSFQLTNNNTDDLNPSYSPDGKRIAYHSSDGPHPSEIYTINAWGGGSFQVTHNDTRDLNPSYSPSGKSITYEAFGGHDSEIYTINAWGRGSIQLTNNDTRDTEPFWGPVAEPVNLPDAAAAAPVPAVRSLALKASPRSPGESFARSVVVAVFPRDGYPGHKLLGLGLIVLTLIVCALLAWKLPMRRP
jgi:predicted heme/steroid binding protein